MATDLNNDAVPLWEGACPDGVVSVSTPETDTPPSGASPLSHLFCVARKTDPKLWKTNPAPLQSATYSRRKSLFCHTFDLSPSTVEPAVGNVGVAG
ncbi:hypothetical protein NIBR502773_18230 [Pseudomonas sp. NIBRBAC000502773]|nr:hypothetical protein NIBR502773_18230 [Pseudomonas sp. NIBRBAC000502773]